MSACSIAVKLGVLLASLLLCAGKSDESRLVPGRVVAVHNQSELSSALIAGNYIILTSNIFINEPIVVNGIVNLTIDGRGFALDGQGKLQVLTVSSSSLALHDVVVRNGYSTGNGGGMFVERSELSMASCQVFDNAASSGGGLYITAGSGVVMTYCFIFNNTATKGGGLYINGDINTAPTLTATQCVVSDNTANSYGGGLYLYYADVHMFSCRVTRNKGVVNSLGGGFFLSDGTITLNDCFVANNYAGGGGGFYALNAASASLLDTLIFENEADNGAGLFLSSADFVLSRCNITFNIVKSNGAGMYATRGSITSVKCIISHNSAKTEGGGIFTYSGVLVSLTQCLLTGNVASYAGGGIYSMQSTYELKLTTISANTAPTGAGVYVDLSSLITFTSSSIVGNAGHGLYAYSGFTEAYDLSYRRNGFDNSIGGPGAKAVECYSRCNASTYGNCTVAIGARKCYINCECYECLPGRSSTTVGSTSVADCTACSAGQYSEQGSTYCSSCFPGLFAATSEDDVSGGVVEPATSGASVCNACPRGLFNPSKSVVVCQTCLEGSSSSPGATACLLAAPGYFVEPSDSLFRTRRCPPNSKCEGGDLLPLPSTGYWVDMKSLSHVFKCLRASCPGELNSISNRSNASCWTKASYLSCDPNFQCSQGSGGVLCGHCAKGYYYTSLTNSCRSCVGMVGTGNIVLLSVGVVFAMAVVCVFARDVPPWLSSSNIYRFIAAVQRTGASRIIISTYGIVDRASWTVSQGVPASYRELASAISVISLNIVSVSCFSIQSKLPSVLLDVIIWSLAPFALWIIISGLCAIRVAQIQCNYRGTESAHKVAREEVRTAVESHINAILMTMYYFLPLVTQRQFEALDCITVDGLKYLRADTAVRCDGRTFRAFIVADILFIASYMAIPLLWFVLLKRCNLNPKARHEALAVFLVSRNNSAKHISFLYSSYRPRFYYFEVLEVLRRIMFVGVVPLVSERSDRQAAFGMFLSLISAICLREVRPFISNEANVLLHVAQYVILANYATGLVLNTSLSKNVHSIGIVLILANMSIVAVALVLGFLDIHGFPAKLVHQGKRVGKSSEKRIDKTSEWESTVPRSHCLVYFYTCRDECQHYLTHGIPAFKGSPGIVFTTNSPDALDADDIAAFPSREAVLVCELPSQPLVNVDRGFPDKIGLRLLRAELLTALRRETKTDEVVRLSSRCVVRSLLLSSYGPRYHSKTPGSGYLIDSDYLMDRKLSDTQRSACVLIPQTCQEYIREIRQVRATCSEKSWLPMFHYTSSTYAPSIQECGLRWSEKEGALGVFFASRSPISYGLGQNRYKENVLNDCFGITGPESTYDNDIDLVVVYAVDKCVLTLTAFGQMIPREYIDAFSFKDGDGCAFLRPDRILAMFVIRPNDPPRFDPSDKVDVLMEIRHDATNTDSLDRFQREVRLESFSRFTNANELEESKGSLLLVAESEFELSVSEHSVGKAAFLVDRIESAQRDKRRLRSQRNADGASVFEPLMQAASGGSLGDGVYQNA